MEDEEMKMVIEITKEEIVKIIASFYECDESAVDLEVKHEDAGYGTGEYRKCAFADCEEWNMPCLMCKRNCKDYWREKA